MKFICLFIILLTGCSTPFYQELSDVKPVFTCEDYANAWARNATDKGFDCGTLWYLIGDEKYGTKGHAICWAHDSNDNEFYIEPQTGKIVTLTEQEKSTIILKTKGSYSRCFNPYVFNLNIKEK